MQVFALITARGGSKGLPRKNVLKFLGRPLVSWTAEASLKATRIERTFISTDDQEIADAASAVGCEVPFLRPRELANHSATHADVLKHFQQWLNSEGLSPDYIAILQPTSPLRTATDIDAAIDLAEEHNANAVVGVKEVPFTSRPHLVRGITDDGCLLRFQELPDGASELRQDLRSYYATNGSIYLNRTADLFEGFEFMPDGAVPYVMPFHRSIDIDNMVEFRLSEMIMQNLDELDSL